MKQTPTDIPSTTIEGIDNQFPVKADEEGFIPSWPSLRSYIKTFRAGEIVLIASRPSMGKSSFVLNLMIDIATHYQSPTIMFSLEKTAIEITSNLLCIDAGLDGRLWKKPTESLGEKKQKSMMDSVDRLRQSNLFIDDDPELTPSTLRAKLKQMKREHGLKAIVIDYLQLMKDDANPQNQDGRVQELTNISRQLKALAKEFEVPLFVLAQLNRGVESRSEKVPRLSDLRECGGIEQVADVVLLLNRPEYYSIDKNNPIRPGETDIIVAKNRHGEVGTAELMFNRNSMTFQEKDLSEPTS